MGKPSSAPPGDRRAPEEGQRREAMAVGRAGMNRVRRLATAAVAVLVPLVALGGASGAAVPAVKMTLPRSIPPNPVFLKAGRCGVTGANDSAVCNGWILRAIDNARHTEPLASISKSFRLAAFDKLGPAAQLLAIADIERMSRGVGVVYGITAQLDAIALAGAAKQTDPTIKPAKLTLKPGGGYANSWGSNLARGTADPLGSDYYWMYDDGLNSPNTSCTKAKPMSCWSHRINILTNWANPDFCPLGATINVLMGAAEVTTNVSPSPSIAEIFVNDCGKLPTKFVVTWAQVEARIFPAT